MSQQRTDRLLALFFSVFVVTSTFSIALAQISLGMSLALFIGLSARNKRNLFRGDAQPVYLFILLYLFWLILTSSLADSFPAALANCREEWLFLAIPIGIYLLTEQVYRETLVHSFAIAAGLVALYAIVQFLTGTHWLHYTNGTFTPTAVVKPIGNFTHWLTFADYFATAAMFLFGFIIFNAELPPRRFRVILIASMLAIVAVVLTSSRTPITAMLIALVVCLSFKSGRFRWVIIGLVVLVLAIAALLPDAREKFSDKLQRDTSAEYAGSRVYIWSRSWDIVKSNPIFGVGQGHFKEEYIKRLPADIDDSRKHAHAHNDFLNVAAIAGIPGALFFLGIWGSLLRLVGRAAFDLRLSIDRRRIALASLVGSVVFLMTSLTEATFADEEVRQMLMFVWAAGLSARYNDSAGAGQKP
ncbi:MAG: O-antigen ligase family protein [candidate division Zixibacteria bacterium]|nr:O-antigen ligase family protein [candidate division Zixibacteria bacterium]